MRPSAVTTPTILAATVALAIATLSRAADCTGTGTGLVPITELGRTSYLGFFDGGLYPGGANAMPIAHHRTGYQRSLRVQRLNAEGEQDNAGSIVMLSIGMSNTTQEFCGGNAPACQDKIGRAHV